MLLGCVARVCCGATFDGHFGGSFWRARLARVISHINSLSGNHACEGNQACDGNQAPQSPIQRKYVRSTILISQEGGD